MIELVSPLGFPKVEAQAERRPLETPFGRRVGFIWNQYPGNEALLAAPRACSGSTVFT